MVLKLLLFTLIHHSNILMKSYTMLVNCFPFQICQMSMYSYEIIDFSCKGFLWNFQKGGLGGEHLHLNNLHDLWNAALKSYLDTIPDWNLREFLQTCYLCMLALVLLCLQCWGRNRCVWLSPFKLMGIVQPFCGASFLMGICHNGKNTECSQRCMHQWHKRSRASPYWPLKLAWSMGH